MYLLMQNLTMSLGEEEYDGTGDEEGSEFDYSEGHVSQMCFLLGKKRKSNFEEVVNVSTEPPLPLPQNYEARDFRQLTQPDGKGHLSSSVATISAQVGFKCRSVLVKLREVYLRLIEIPHLKQTLKATNLMSVFDYKIGNGDIQVILAIVEHWWPTTHTFHLPCEELGIAPRDFTMLTRIGIGTGEPMEFDESYTDYAGWIEAQHYIVGYHVDYDAYWRYVLHGALMSDIVRCGDIDIPGLGALTSRITFPDGIVVDWEDDKGEAGTSRGRGSRGRTSEGGADPSRRSRPVLHVFIDSSSEEEEEEDIEQSSTDYSDNNVIHEIKLKILRNQAEIEELEEAKSSRTRVGSVVGHKAINRSHVSYNKLLMHDYFRDENVYGSKNFCRRF
ncbi:hypothetical protein GIB67_013664, partial [Kingdonia uniflora]